MISQSTVRNSLTNDCRYKFIELIRTLIQKVNCSTSIKIFYTIIHEHNISLIYIKIIVQNIINILLT